VGDLPEIGEERIPVAVELPGFLADHCYDAKPVLPAVEALQTLARAVRDFDETRDVYSSCKARFLRFLVPPLAAGRMDVGALLAPRADGGVHARLVTTRPAGTSGMTRSVEHVAVTFGTGERPEPLAADIAAAVEGVGSTIPSARLYGEMVRFGPSFHNAADPIVLTSSGATARLRCPGLRPAVGPLGSPFPLDGAFHVCCAWGQSYADKVTFPVGYEARHILRPARVAGDYFCRIFAVSPTTAGGEPASTAPGTQSRRRPEVPGRMVRAGRRLLRFDVWIYNLEGELAEVTLGLDMEDVSRGRLRPPEWAARAGTDLPALRARWPSLTVLELAGLAPFARRCMTPREESRFEELGEKRRREFAAVRVACKQMAGRNGVSAPPREVETLSRDGRTPCCPGAPHCAAAHDFRFVAAVTGERPIGIDVEPVGDKAVRGLHLFTSPEEQRVVRNCPGPLAVAATRAWTVKEAAAKALDMNLAEAWKAVELVAAGEEVSRVRIAGRGYDEARHARVDDHLFTVLELDGEV